MAPRRMSVRPRGGSVAERAVADVPAADELVARAAAVAQEHRRPRPAADLAAAEVRVHDVAPAAGDDDVRPVACVDEVLARAADELVGLRLGLPGGLVV